MGWANWTQWSPAFEPGNLTAVCSSPAAGQRVTDTKLTPGAAASLRLTLDAPSERTGTGSALVLDGQDAGLVRVSLVDARGTLVTDAANDVNVTFGVACGPGRIVGVGNGDPTSHELNTASWRTTFHGLARAVVGVTANHARLDRDRQRRIDIDAVAGRDDFQACPGGGIRVTAEASGLTAHAIVIPTSTDISQHGVLASGTRSVRSGVVPEVA